MKSFTFKHSFLGLLIIGLMFLGLLLQSVPVARAYAYSYTASNYYELVSDINQANVPGGSALITINFNITLLGTLPALTGDITIDGTGHQINGDSKYRVFDIKPLANVTIFNLTLTNAFAKGEDGQSGTVGPAGTDQSGYSTVRGSNGDGGGDGWAATAGSDGKGGAILVEGGKLVCQNCFFWKNSIYGGNGGSGGSGGKGGNGQTAGFYGGNGGPGGGGAEGGHGGQGLGGAIYVESGNLTVKDSLFVDNQAVGGAGGHGGDGGSGGDGGPSGDPGVGGLGGKGGKGGNGADGTGGAIYNNYGLVAIIHNTFQSSKVQGGNAGNGGGGGRGGDGGYASGYGQGGNGGNGGDGGDGGDGYAKVNRNAHFDTNFGEYNNTYTDNLSLGGTSGFKGNAGRAGIAEGLDGTAGRNGGIGAAFSFDNWFVTPLDPNDPRIDIMAPTTTLTTVTNAAPYNLSVSPDGTNGWFKSDFAVAIRATDNTSVKNIHLVYNGAQNGTLDQATNFGVPVTTEGITSFTAYAVDQAGNIESPAKTTSVLLDKTPPVLPVRLLHPNSDLTRLMRR